MLDLKICNGTIVNGTGAPGFNGDVGVRAGRIVAVGDIADDAKDVIDATGLVVSPGFVDTHTHYDAQLYWDRLLSPSTWYGVTTVVMGNCGFALAPCKAEDRSFLLRTLQYVEGIQYESSWPALNDGDWGYESFPEYLAFLESNNCAINVVTQIGHTALRVWVMGAEAATSRVATDDELDEMARIVTEALNAGAVGLSTTGASGHNGIGGIPVPSRWADDRELRALAHAITRARHGRLQGTLGTTLNPLLVLDLLEETGVPLAEITPTQRADLRATLWDLGYRIFPQVQIIPGSLYTGLHDPSYFALNLAAGRGAKQLYDLFGPAIRLPSSEERLTYYREPGFLERFVAETDIDSWNDHYWPTIQVAKAPTRPEWNDRLVVDVARETGLKPAEVIYEVCVASNLSGRFRIFFPPEGEFPGLETLQQHTDAGVGLHDAGAHLSQIATACWPGRLLGKFVREGGLPLERAVQQATSLGAAQFGIVDRGLLIEGQAADIVIFDPETIGDGPVTEVHDLPGGASRLITEPTGIEHVIVNGTPIRERNKDLVDPQGTLPGNVLRDFQPLPRSRRREPIPGWVRDEVARELDARIRRLTEINNGTPPMDPAQPGRIML